jgi:hypothetical protein
MSIDKAAVTLIVIATLLPAAGNAQTVTPPKDPSQTPPTFQDTVQVTATRFVIGYTLQPAQIDFSPNRKPSPKAADC